MATRRDIELIHIVNFFCNFYSLKLFNIESFAFNYILLSLSYELLLLKFSKSFSGLEEVSVYKKIFLGEVLLEALPSPSHNLSVWSNLVAMSSNSCLL